MSKDEMIKLAIEAGWQYADGDDGYSPLWRFGDLVAAAVAAAEREALTARILRCRYPVCKTIKPSGHDWDIPRLDEVIEAIRARGEK
jgi:hypothetical protein